MTAASHPTPEQEIARIEAKCDVLTTPSGDGEMVWRAFGDGPPLVLLHGAYGSWMHWIRNVEALSKHFRVLAADMPGFGDSASPADTTSVVSLVETIARGLDRLTAGDGPVFIGGFSYGGSMSAPVTLASKRKIDTICMVGTHGLGGKRGEPGPLVNWYEAKGPEAMHEAQRHNLSKIMFADAAKIDDLAIHIQTANTVRTVFRPRLVVDRDKIAGAVAKVDARLTAIWGNLDATAYPYVDECVERFMKVRPEAVMHLLDGVGHWACYEAAQKFNPIMIETLGMETADASA